MNRFLLSLLMVWGGLVAGVAQAEQRAWDIFVNTQLGYGAMVQTTWTRMPLPNSTPGDVFVLGPNSQLKLARTPYPGSLEQFIATYKVARPGMTAYSTSLIGSREGIRAEGEMGPLHAIEYFAEDNGAIVSLTLLCPKKSLQSLLSDLSYARLSMGIFPPDTKRGGRYMLGALILKNATAQSPSRVAATSDSRWIPFADETTGVSTTVRPEWAAMPRNEKSKDKSSTVYMQMNQAPPVQLYFTRTVEESKTPSPKKPKGMLHMPDFAYGANTKVTRERMVSGLAAKDVTLTQAGTVSRMVYVPLDGQQWVIGLTLPAAADPRYMADFETVLQRMTLGPVKTTRAPPTVPDIDKLARDAGTPMPPESMRVSESCNDPEDPHSVAIIDKLLIRVCKTGIQEFTARIFPGFSHTIDGYEALHRINYCTDEPLSTLDHSLATLSVILSTQKVAIRFADEATDAIRLANQAGRLSKTATDEAREAVAMATTKISRAGLTFVSKLQIYRTALLMKAPRGYQWHHLNQYAAFKETIDKSDGLVLLVKGGVGEIGSQHRTIHRVLDEFWEIYRNKNSRPTVATYHKALANALSKAGFNAEEVTLAIDAARANLRKFGYTDKSLVDLVPNPTYF